MKKCPSQDTSAGGAKSTAGRLSARSPRRSHPGGPPAGRGVVGTVGRLIPTTIATAVPRAQPPGPEYPHGRFHVLAIFLLDGPCGREQIRNHSSAAFLARKPFTAIIARPNPPAGTGTPPTSPALPSFLRAIKLCRPFFTAAVREKDALAMVRRFLGVG